jgi:hypothetical protein
VSGVKFQQSATPDINSRMILHRIFEIVCIQLQVVGVVSARIPLFFSGAATVISGTPSELIAVENRTHNIFMIFTGSKNVLSTIILSIAKRDWAET